MDTIGPTAAERERLAAARQRIEERLSAGPPEARDLYDLAGICEALGDLPAAIRHCGASAGLAPGWRPPVLRLADLLRAAGRQQDAVVAYGRALELDPADAEVHLKLANLLSEARRYADAVDHYGQASTARPDWYLPHLNRGNGLAAAGDLDGARAAYDQALATGGPDGIRMRRDLVLPIVAESGPIYAAAHDLYATALAALAADPPRIGHPLSESPGSRFFLAFHGEEDRRLQERLAQVYLAACPSLAWTAPHCGAGGHAGRSRRIAIVSRFLFDHSVGRLSIGLIRRLAARSDCEICLFETAAMPSDEVADEIRTLATQVVRLPADLQAAREAIAAVSPDVAFYPEIGMEPVAYFLAFARLAPVQCVTAGHPITSGIPAIDYFLSFRGAEPEEAENAYSERLIRLQGLPFSYDRPPRPMPPKARSDFGLDDSTRIYFLAQNLFKIHPDMDAALGRILNADPGGVILMLEGHDPSWGTILRRRFRQTLGDAAGRIVFLPRQSHDDYMRVLALADVSLDSFPFSGGNTTYQSLAMGTPVVTLPSPLMRGRISLAIYDRMEMMDCVARDIDDYARIAVRLGTEPGFAADVRRRIAEGCDVIFRDTLFLDEAERFLMTARPPGT